MARPAQLVRVVGWLAIAAVVLKAGSARADDAVTQADRLFKEGRRAAEQREYGEACRLFDESYRLDPAVGTLINLGDCAEHLADLERAYQYYRTASERLVDGDDRLPRVRARLEAIDQRAAKVAVRLAPGAPDGTLVTVDGTTVDPHRAPLHLGAGNHVVLVSAVGHRGMRYDVAVAEGEIRAVEVSPGPALEPVVVARTEHPARAREHQGWTRPAAIATLGVGLASVWMGSLAGVMAIDKRDLQDASCGSSGCSQAGVDAAHEGAALAAASTVTFIVGGVLVAAGVVLLTLPLTSHATARVAVSPRGITLAGTF